MAMPWRGRGRQRKILTQITLQTPMFRLHRRMYRLPASGTYQSDPRRRRSAAAESSQRCRERRARTFSTKLGNVIKNGYVYATLPSIIRESALRRPRTLNPPLWRRVALQLHKVRIDGCQAMRGNAAPSDACHNLLRALEPRIKSFAVPLLQSLGTAFNGRRRANGRSAATRRVSPWTRADQHLFRLA